MRDKYFSMLLSGTLTMMVVSPPLRTSYRGSAILPHRFCFRGSWGVRGIGLASFLFYAISLGVLFLHFMKKSIS